MSNPIPNKFMEAKRGRLRDPFKTIFVAFCVHLPSDVARNNFFGALEIAQDEMIAAEERGRKAGLEECSSEDLIFNAFYVDNSMGLLRHEAEEIASKISKAIRSLSKPEVGSD